MFFTNLFCSPAKNDIPKEWTRDLATEYFKKYAIFERKRFDECIKVNNDHRLRAKIGAAEFEYIDSNRLFIVRGIIDNDFLSGDPKFIVAMHKKIEEVNKNSPKKFKGAYLETDKTGHEIYEETPERLNLRKDYLRPIELNLFIKEVDKMMNYAYNYSESDYRELVGKITKEIWNFDD